VIRRHQVHSIFEPFRKRGRLLQKAQLQRRHACALNRVADGPSVRRDSTNLNGPERREHIDGIEAQLKYAHVP